ncbi:MAG TPA: hypothetical protein VGG83_28930, partial [Trebonia sp.]
VLLYLAIASLAMVGGPDIQRTEAVLLTALIFLGFNVAWMFLFTPLDPTKVTPQDRPEVPGDGALTERPGNGASQSAS